MKKTTLLTVENTIYNLNKLTDKAMITPRSKGMESITELYKIGRGPSSSHTIGPEKASVIFKERNKNADVFKAILYGSLAKTGRGHGTDAVIQKTFFPKKCEVVFDYSQSSLPHPNTMDLVAYCNGVVIDRARVMSVGGGSISFDGLEIASPPKIYSMSSFADIAGYCKGSELRLWQYVEQVEGADIHVYMNTVWETMKEAVRRGLSDDGELPGGLVVKKKAKALFNSQHIDESAETRENRMVYSYAYAVSLASFLWDSRKISFDKVLIVMKEKGRDLSASYRETSEAGLAKIDISNDSI